MRLRISPLPTQVKSLGPCVSFLTVLLCFAVFLASQAQAEIHPETVFLADSKKTARYKKQGLFTGGDQSVNRVVVKNIRRSTQRDYERIVIDLEGSHDGEPLAIERPPYYQVSLSPEESKVVLSIWGTPRIEFDTPSVVQSFHKSALIEKLELLPKVEENIWTFALKLKSPSPVEVFELSQAPGSSGMARIIIDISKGALKKKTGRN